MSKQNIDLSKIRVKLSMKDNNGYDYADLEVIDIGHSDKILMCRSDETDKLISDKEKLVKEIKRLSEVAKELYNEAKHSENSWKYSSEESDISTEVKDIIKN